MNKYLIIVSVLLTLSSCSFVMQDENTPDISISQGENFSPKNENAGQGGGNPANTYQENEYMVGSLTLDNFKSMQEISSPYILTGKAPRSWFFEGSFPIKLMTLNNDVITTTYASGDWLAPIGENSTLNATDMIDFTSHINFTIPENINQAKLQFIKDNSSGMFPEEYAETIVTLIDGL